MKGRVLAAGFAVVVLAQMTLSLNASAGGSESTEEPTTSWDITQATSLELVGSYAAMVNIPTALAGQSDPAWSYEHVFGFSVGGNTGTISLDITGGDRTASMSIIDDDDMGPDFNGTKTIDYDWEIERFYFPFVLVLPGGVLGGWVYDVTADEFTFIGVLTFPTGWGLLEPETTTQTVWTGPGQDSCAHFPRADLYRYPPIGSSAGVANESAHVSSAVLAGDCEGTVTGELPPYRHYRTGSLVAPPP